MRAALLGGALLLAACARPAPPPEPPEQLARLAGEWTITVKMREDASSDWSEFRTSAVIDELFEGRVLRERPVDTGKPWREIALTRWDAASGELVFEHVFSRSLSMLQMRGRLDPATGVVSYSGEWHRQRGDEVRKEPASGTLTLESEDRHVWRLDKIAADGSRFVDLEMLYERRP